MTFTTKLTKKQVAIVAVWIAFMCTMGSLLAACLSAILGLTGIVLIEKYA